MLPKNWETLVEFPKYDTRNEIPNLSTLLFYRYICMNQTLVDKYFLISWGIFLNYHIFFISSLKYIEINFQTKVFLSAGVKTFSDKMDNLHFIQFFLPLVSLRHWQIPLKGVYRNKFIGGGVRNLKSKFKTFGFLDIRHKYKIF